MKGPGIGTAAAALVLLAAGSFAQQASGAFRSADAVKGAAVARPNRRLAPRELLRRGYLAPRPAAYARAKNAASARAELSPSSPLRPAPAATVTRTWPGLSDKSGAPPDTTDAIGPSRYIELVNAKFAIYGRASPAPLSRGRLSDLIGAGHFDFLTDPQILWDPDTRRFYYAEVDATGPRHHYLAVGYSKGPSPSAPRNWCKYFYPFGRSFPDFPKLGDTADFILVGVNRFHGRSYDGSDVVWAAKPGAGRRCPRSLRGGIKNQLVAGGGRPAFSPVPTNQVDRSRRGWIVATPSGPAPQHELSLFSVHPTAKGSAAIQEVGSRLAVSPYAVPPNAPQLGSDQRLDTADGRLTEAISAIDPSRPPGDRTAIWTQHTVAGGGGSQVDWYEIDPAAESLFQAGVVADPLLSAFNGAISPDRADDGTSAAFGQNMVMDFDTSSATTLPAIALVSELAGNPQSPPQAIRASSSPVADRHCAHVCRWGDYGGASPDPTPPVGASAVWMASQWQAGPREEEWKTVNFVASP